MVSDVGANLAPKLEGEATEDQRQQDRA